MKDKKNLIAIILAILAIVVVIINLIPKKEVEEISNPIIVTNYSDFYTVNSCLYRTITYVSAQDTESLLLLLNDKYKSNNNITKNNVLDLFSDVGENSTFVSEKMYYENLNNNLTKYYVKGYVANQQILDEDILSAMERESTYFIVYLDSSSNIFSVEPYNGNIFEEVK